MTTMIKCMATTLAMLASVQVAESAEMTPFSATYVLNIDGKTGKATRTLTQLGNHFNYEVSARIAAVATANQSASFTLSSGQVVPMHASSSYKAFGIGHTHSIKYQGNQILSTYKGKTIELVSQQQAYDDLSLEMQIRQELLNNKFSGSYWLVKKTTIEQTRFKKAGNVKIKTPVGVYETVRIDRIHDDHSRATSFYLAPSLNYLPIKVSQTNDGKTISMVLSKLD